MSPSLEIGLRHRSDYAGVVAAPTPSAAAKILRKAPTGYPEAGMRPMMTRRCRRHRWRVTAFDLAAMRIRYRCASCSKSKWTIVVFTYREPIGKTMDKAA